MVKINITINVNSFKSFLFKANIKETKRVQDIYTEIYPHVIKQFKENKSQEYLINLKIERFQSFRDHNHYFKYLDKNKKGGEGKKEEGKEEEYVIPSNLPITELKTINLEICQKTYSDSPVKPKERSNTILDFVEKTKDSPSKKK